MSWSSSSCCVLLILAFMFLCRPKMESSEIYQFKTVLLGTFPTVWRRLQIRGNSTFEDFHSAIQEAMNWDNLYTHEFDFNGSLIGPHDEYDQERLREDKVQIHTHFKAPGDKCSYVLHTYDIGDKWTHDVVLEDVLPEAEGETYPKYVIGEHNTPPSRCGGMEGYNLVRDIMIDTNHPEHEEEKQWMEEEGYRWDGTEFTLSADVCADTARKYQNDPNGRPRGTLSAYAFFLQDSIESHRKEYPNDPVDFAEFTTKCSENWKSMPDEEKKRFHDLAVEDTVRYPREMADFARRDTSRTEDHSRAVRGTDDSSEGPRLTSPTSKN